MFLSLCRTTTPERCAPTAARTGAALLKTQCRVVTIPYVYSRTCNVFFFFLPDRSNARVTRARAKFAHSHSTRLFRFTHVVVHGFTARIASILPFL